SRGKGAGQMIMHTALMVAASLAIIPLGATGGVYGVGAAAAGLLFGFLVVRYALRVRRGLSGRALGPMVVFHGSISYLAVAFVTLRPRSALPGRPLSRSCARVTAASSSCT